MTQTTISTQTVLWDCRTGQASIGRMLIDCMLGLYVREVHTTYISSSTYLYSSSLYGLEARAPPNECPVTRRASRGSRVESDRCGSSRKVFDRLAVWSAVSRPTCSPCSSTSVRQAARADIMSGSQPSEGFNNNASSDGVAATTAESHADVTTSGECTAGLPSECIF